MRVLHIFHGQYLSGAEFVAFDCLGLDRDREDYAAILCTSPALAAMLKERLGSDRVLELDLPMEVSRLDRWLFFSRATKHLARILPSVLRQRGKPLEDFDLLYYNNTIEIALTARLSPPCPEICHVHDMVSTLQPPVRRAFIQGARRCSHVLTVSKAAALEITALLGPDYPVTPLYNAAPTGFSMPRSKAPDIKGFVFFGGSYHRKGLDIAISGLTMTGKPGLSLDIYGEVVPRLRNRLLRQTKGVALRFHGQIPRDAVPKAMRAADVVLLTSRRDPLPTVILEALAHGCPVVAAAVDGVPEMISDRRFLFEPGNPSSLARCLNALADMPTNDFLEAISGQGAFAAQRFNAKDKCAVLAAIMVGVVAKGVEVKCL